MISKLALAVLACMAGGSSFAQCYTVYDRDNRVVYQSRQSPVDMSRSLHETVPGVFPGGHLVFDNVSSCDTFALPRQPRSSKPVFELHSVPSRPGADPTRSMGAGPTGGAAVRKMSSSTVITEMHNPPLTAVQTDGRISFESPLDQ